jgi:hypothetical protein
VKRARWGGAQSPSEKRVDATEAGRARD